jgi:DNA (cytosine-5)-methyltransferase 1
MHKVLDLFSGIGGFSLGLERTGGFETVAFCEIDEKARKVLGKHWPDVSIYEDIKEMTIEQLQADGIVPTVITGGFPCQDISFAGKGAGIVGERSSLWNEMFRLIRDVRPEWVIAENVSALRSRGLALVLQDLCSIGYCVEWHCIPASAVGAPHQRDRIWIIAYCNTNCNSEPISPEYAEASGMLPYVADSLCEHQAERGECEIAEGESGSGRTESRGSQGDAEWERSVRGSGSGAGEDVADANQPRLERWLITSLQECALQQSIGEGSSLEGKLSDKWSVEPNVGRVADGVPGRVDRLKQIGNAVVPQLPELLGTAILSSEGKLSDNQRTPTP